MQEINTIPHATIFGISGTEISDAERALFTRFPPLGFILFTRNITSPEQTKALVTELKSLTHPSALILIDQEGGRVARLKPPHWDAYPPPGTFATLAQHNPTAAQEALYTNYRLIADDLYQCGINVDCAPMLDIPVSGSNDDVLGDRALGKTAEEVISLAPSICRGLLEGGVLPVIKHIPGHGRATVDSHHALPTVDTEFTLLQDTDFAPFKALNHIGLGMTAHILYSAIDAQKSATLSTKVVDIIRNIIGFNGLLMTDDLSMKALNGRMDTLALDSLNAGCDVVLHCNGNIDEMETIAHATPKLSEPALTRFQAAWQELQIPKPIDRAALLEKRDQLLKQAAPLTA